MLQMARDSQRQWAADLSGTYNPNIKHCQITPLTRPNSTNRPATRVHPRPYPHCNARYDPKQSFPPTVYSAPPYDFSPRPPIAVRPASTGASANPTQANRCLNWPYWPSFAEGHSGKSALFPAWPTTCANFPPVWLRVFSFRFRDFAID
ncbi:hypothetical protein BCR44DRAFT_280223 [Catenaria anguillulae PL171]|uniref:Uncharacterized protein n=1 Tax=Catenaria anguillulae PL171 TaxID=765915 RepID=A0A1Y2HN47_9FUNG|nr:hypothetical protein BCR44DRAFT_280223 [Catenaria anguillulae PL171]